MQRLPACKQQSGEQDHGQQPGAPHQALPHVMTGFNPDPGIEEGGEFPGQRFECLQADGRSALHPQQMLGEILVVIACYLLEPLEQVIQGI